MLKNRIRVAGLLTVVLLVLLPAATVAQAQVDAGELAYGDDVLGRLTSGQSDEWRFSGGAGDVVSITMASGVFDTFLEVHDAAGQLLMENDDGATGLNSLIDSLVLPAAGEYSIIARGLTADASGAYVLSLRLENTGKGTATTASAINYGDVVEGQLTGGGQNWTFQGAAGDVVTIALSSTEFDTFLELRDAGGVLLTEDDDSGGNLNSLIGGFTLPQTGSYTIVARGFNRQATGPYTLTLNRGAAPIMPGSNNLSYGDTVFATLSDPAGAEWTFAGSAGDVVTIALNSSDFDTIVELQAPDGFILTGDDDSGGNLNSLIRNFRLPTTGTYTIIARSFGSSNVGDYDLSLQLTQSGSGAATGGTGSVGGAGAAAASSINIGDTVVGVVESREGDAWTFSGSAGDVVTIALSSAEFDTFLELRDAAGEIIDEDDDGGDGLNSQITGFMLPATGSYTIVARGFAGDTGTYELTLQSGAVAAGGGGSGGPPPPGAMTINVGDTVVGVVESREGDAWTFSGSAGDVVTVALSSTEFDTFLELRDAAGEIIDEDDDGGDGLNSQIADFMLPATGSYTIVARGFAGDTGTYELTLQSGAVAAGGGGTTATARTLNYGDTVMSTLGSVGFEGWTFTGSAGDVITIAMSSEDFDTVIDLRDARGGLVASDDDGGRGLNSLLSDFRLPASGTYTIQARSIANCCAGDYRLSLTRKAN